MLGQRSAMSVIAIAKQRIKFGRLQRLAPWDSLDSDDDWIPDSRPGDFPRIFDATAGRALQCPDSLLLSFLFYLFFHLLPFSLSFLSSFLLFLLSLLSTFY